MLFSRGNAMSGAPIISGMNQLPKPPISAGMTEKKIISSPCDGDDRVPLLPGGDDGVAREVELRAHDLRQDAADHAADHGEASDRACRCPCGWCCTASGRRSRACGRGGRARGRGWLPTSSVSFRRRPRGSVPNLRRRELAGLLLPRPRTWSSPATSQALNSCSGTARTTIGMRLWLVPQIWLHSP